MARQAAPLPPAPSNEKSRYLQMEAINASKSTDALLSILDRAAEEARTSLLVASEAGNAEAVRRVLGARTIRPDQCKGLDNYSALHHAAGRGHAQVVSLLLRSGATVDACTNRSETPLHLASYGGHLEVAEMLLDAGAAIGRTNEDGESPLFFAASRGHPALVRILLQRGANPQQQDRYGETAREQAADGQTAHAFDMGKVAAALRLPLQALNVIFQFLPSKELGRAACVCTSWHRAAEKQELYEARGCAAGR